MDDPATGKDIFFIEFYKDHHFHNAGFLLILLVANATTPKPKQELLRRSVQPYVYLVYLLMALFAVCLVYLIGY